jgi:hypothetical protein
MNSAWGRLVLMQIKKAYSRRTYPTRVRRSPASKIRSYRGLEGLTDDEARQAMIAIEKLSNLLYYMLKKNEIICHENILLD